MINCAYSTVNVYVIIQTYWILLSWTIELDATSRDGVYDKLVNAN